MIDRIKRNNDELKADRPTVEEIKSIPRLPISILVENVRSVHNVGSIFRTADGVGAEMIYLTGYTACPPRKDLSKTALGAEEVVPWQHFDNPIDAANTIIKEGISLVLIEQTKISKPIYDISWQFPLCFIIGNEVDGVSEELSSMCQIHAEIPMRGIKQSLNVSVATGIVGYEFSKIYSSLRK